MSRLAPGPPVTEPVAGSARRPPTTERATEPVAGSGPGPPTTEPAGGSAGVTAALPVVLDVAGPLAPEVRRYVEGILGWQSVDAVTAPMVPPTLRLVSCETGGDGRPTVRTGAAPPVPTVLLIDDDVDVTDGVEAGARLRPAATLRWPAERGQLADVAGALLRAPVRGRPAADVVRVVGTGGGVGTSTVALALAGLAAWSDRRVLVAVDPGAPVARVPVVPGDALAVPGLLQRAAPLSGVDGAFVVAVDGPVPELDGGVTGADLVVVDAGRSPDGDVVVCRPDRVGLERLPTTTAGAVVVNGDGPVPPRRLVRAAGGRRSVTLPTSPRVARAGLHARVPTSLPGSWLRRLLPVVPHPAPRPPDP